MQRYRLIALALGCVLLASRQGAAVDVDWPVHSGDKLGRRYASLDQINRSNVAGLELAWTYRTGEAQRRGSAFARSNEQNIPIVASDSLIICSPFNRVIALDPASGTEKWFFEPQISDDLSAEKDVHYTCRGVAHWKDPRAEHDAFCAERLFFGTNDLRLFAIDAATGKRCREFGGNGEIAIPPDRPESFRGEVQYVMPPAIIGDIVILGSSIFVRRILYQAPLGRAHRRRHERRGDPMGRAARLNRGFSTATDPMEPRHA